MLFVCYSVCMCVCVLCRDLTNQAAAVLHYDAAIVAFQMNLLDTTLQHLTKVFCHSKV
jgi:hypothetical protein